MSSAGFGGVSLRARFMLIVVGGAILPLALIGAWLSVSAARSGRQLLRTELDSSLVRLGQRVSERWAYRVGDLALLAGNEAARDALTGRLALPATHYLDELARSMQPSIARFVYRDGQGVVRWSSEIADRGATGGAPRRGLPGFAESDALLVMRPVLAANGTRLGTVEAQVLLSAILPTDSVQLIVAGSALRIHDRESGESLGRAPIVMPGAAGIVSSRIALTDPPLDLELAASDAPYVAPFSRAARLGLGALLLVTIVALMLTTFLTRRVTASLEQMVTAADAVARGDLEQRVTSAGDDDIGRLAVAFNTMTENLRRTLRELARGETLAAVGQFAAAMSHEIRNALTAVRLDLQRLHERTDSHDDRALMGRVLRNVHRLDSIVTGSLRIARTTPETMRSVVIEGVVRAAMTAAEPAFAESGSGVLLDPMEREAPRVKADPAALEHLFLNLFLNSAQAMTPGGVARVSIRQSNGHTTVRIADSGHGITSENLARLGEPFFSSKRNGTGLGFPIARQIVAAHGGNISVVETSPAGTTIDVMLPSAGIDVG